MVDRYVMAAALERMARPVPPLKRSASYYEDPVKTVSPSASAIASVRKIIRPEEVVGVFGQILTQSPELYQKAIADLARECGTDPEATAAYVHEVMSSLTDHE